MTHPSMISYGILFAEISGKPHEHGGNFSTLSYVYKAYLSQGRLAITTASIPNLVRGGVTTSVGENYLHKSNRFCAVYCHTCSAHKVLHLKTQIPIMVAIDIEILMRAIVGLRRVWLCSACYQLYRALVEKRSGVIGHPHTKKCVPIIHEEIKRICMKDRSRKFVRCSLSR